MKALTTLASMILIAGLILFFIHGVLALADLIDVSTPALVATVTWWCALAFLCWRGLKTLEIKGS